MIILGKPRQVFKIAQMHEICMRIPLLTISPEVVIENLEEREGVPGVGVLETEDGVHVNCEQ